MRFGILLIKYKNISLGFYYNSDYLLEIHLCVKCFTLRFFGLCFYIQWAKITNEM